MGWLSQAQACAHSLPHTALCPDTLLDTTEPVDWSPLGSSVHGISQVRTLEGVTIPFSRESSPPSIVYINYPFILHKHSTMLSMDPYFTDEKTEALRGEINTTQL